jgi:Meiotically up-regulated gene 113
MLPTKEGPGWIYALQEVATSHIKIGCTQVSVEQRRQKISWSMRTQLVYVASVYVTVKPFIVERHVLESLRTHRIEGHWEWFDLAMDQQTLETLVAQACINAARELRLDKSTRLKLHTLAQKEGIPLANLLADPLNTPTHAAQREQKQINALLKKALQTPAPVLTYSQMMTKQP